MPVAAYPRGPFQLDRLASDWQLALDAAQGALECSGHAYPLMELQVRRGLLLEERRLTVGLLERVARVDHATVLSWLSPVLLDRRLQGTQ